MISAKTASDIWSCYREIESGEILLADMAEALKIEEHESCNRKELEPTLKDCFGRKSKLQLGVPSGHGSHRLFGVSYRLGEAIIRAHIAEKQAELSKLREIALIELGTEKIGVVELKDPGIEF